jgi:DNA integrity scanning protein DisA with diadenylate cyclase activity
VVHDVDRRRRAARPGFVAAWVFLVVVVSFGFYIQARTIDRLETDEQVISDYVEAVDRQQNRNVGTLCVLLIELSAEEQHPMIFQAFDKIGIDCRALAKGR